MAGAVRSAVQVPTLRGAAADLPPWRARGIAGAGGEPREDRIEVPDDIRLAPDHQAVPALPSPDTAARSDVDVVDTALRELLRAPDVVDVIRIPAVDG